MAEAGETANDFQNMNQELFTIPECKSPRLQWIEENGILTVKDTYGTWHAVIPKDGDEWIGAAGLAMKYHGTLAASRVAKGQSEDDALTNLAKAANLRLWNERGLP